MGAVSGDGSRVVGYAGDSSGRDEAFIWDAGHGMRPLAQVLAAEAADPTGWTLQQAFGISADGPTIVGCGTNPSGQTEAWIAVLAEPSTDALRLTGLLGLAVVRQRRS